MVFDAVMSRYLGMRVAVSMGDSYTAVGDLAECNPDFVRLTDVRMIDAGESSGWLESSMLLDEESPGAPTCPEMIIISNWIRSVRCLDDSILDAPRPAPAPRLRDLRVSSNALERLARGVKLNPPADEDETSPSDAIAAIEGDEPEPVIALGVNLGPVLVALASPDNGKLGDSIIRMRKVLREELGVVMPSVRLRSDESLDPFGFRILAEDCVVIHGEIPHLQSLAIDLAPAGSSPPLDSPHARATVDPILKRKAYWISPDEQDSARMAGYSVFDPVVLITSSLAETARRTAAEWLTFEMVDELLTELRTRHPLLVSQLYPEAVPLRTIHGVLRGLLAEQVPVRNLARILEFLGRNVSNGVTIDALVARTRVDQARVVCRPHCDDAMRLTAIPVDEPLADMLGEAFAGLSLCDHAARLVAFDAVLRMRWEATTSDPPPVLLVAPKLRPPLAEYIRRTLPRLAVLSTDEICPEVTLRRDPEITQLDIERWLDEHAESTPTLAHDEAYR